MIFFEIIQSPCSGFTVLKSLTANPSSDEYGKKGRICTKLNSLQYLFRKSPRLKKFLTFFFFIDQRSNKKIFFRP